MISKRSKRLKPQNFATKLLLGTALFVLLWSRILSSFLTIQEVEASFNDEVERGVINPPVIADQEIGIAHHRQIQDTVSQNRDIRLEKIEEDAQMAQRIRDFYTGWGSPMGAYAEYIVEVSDQFGLDPRLIPAISVVESSGGVHCFKPYNAFGWGKMGFNNFEESIYTVAYGLANGYRTSNPYAIGPTYNPVTPDAWSNKVMNLMNQI